MPYIFGKEVLELTCAGSVVPPAYGTGWTLMRTGKPEGGRWTAQQDGTWKDITDYDQVKKIEKEALIREAFAKASTAPVTVSVEEGTFTFNGGQDSANAINGAVSLALELGESTVVLTDITNAPVILTPQSAAKVVTQIKVFYRRAFLKKQEELFELSK